MLSTRVYNRALNLAAETHKRAIQHGDKQEADRQLDLFMRIVGYGHRHGLVLDTLDRFGKVGLCFGRNEGRFDTRYITLDHEG